MASSQDAYEEMSHGSQPHHILSGRANPKCRNQNLNCARSHNTRKQLVKTEVNLNNLRVNVQRKTTIF